ncbi:MAG: hypothetical protein SGCHY_005368, partial [Lobulomycetales sp.]
MMIEEDTELSEIASNVTRPSSFRFNRDMHDQVEREAGQYRRSQAYERPQYNRNQRKLSLAYELERPQPERPAESKPRKLSLAQHLEIQQLENWKRAVATAAAPSKEGGMSRSATNTTVDMQHESSSQTGRSHASHALSQSSMPPSSVSTHQSMIMQSHANHQRQWNTRDRSSYISGSSDGSSASLHQNQASGSGPILLQRRLMQADAPSLLQRELTKSTTESHRSSASLHQNQDSSSGPAHLQRRLMQADAPSLLQRELTKSTTDEYLAIAWTEKIRESFAKSNNVPTSRRNSDTSHSKFNPAPKSARARHTMIVTQAFPGIEEHGTAESAEEDSPSHKKETYRG